MKTKYERKQYLQNLKQEDHLDDPLEITRAEAITFLGVLIKIGIKTDMKDRGIEKWEDYVETLLKEYAASTN